MTSMFLFIRITASHHGKVPAHCMCKASITLHEGSVKEYVKVKNSRQRRVSFADRVRRIVRDRLDRDWSGKLYL